MKQGSNIRNTLLLIGIFLFLVGPVSIPSPAMAASPIPGLVAYYPFNGNANDASGNGNHGTAIGATLTADRFGNANSAYSFDGIDDYIQVPYSSYFNFNYPITLTAWVYLVDNSKGGIVGQWGYGGSGGDAYILYVSNSYLATAVPRTGSLGHYFLHGVTPLPTNQWIFVSMVSDGSLVQLFVNGSQDASVALQVYNPNSTQPLKIGLEEIFFGAQNYFKGVIDEIQIYNRALTSDEIAQLYGYALIDPTKWADLEFIRRIEGGALRSEVRNYGSNISNNLTFIDPNNVTSIKADVTVTDLIYNGAFTRALIHGFFYNDDLINPSSSVRAEVAIGDFGSGLRATYSVGRCPDLNCTTYTPFTSGSLGAVILGTTHILSVSWDGTQFAFRFDNNPLVTYNPQGQGYPPPTLMTSPIPFKAIGTQVSSGPGGFVSALFDNVYINGSSMKYDDFNSADGLIDSGKWKHYTLERDQALEIVREQISDGVFGMAIRSYGSFANNSLNLLNGQSVKELQADLTLEKLENNAAIPQASLFGSFYNDGTSGFGGIGDIRALVGIRHNGTQPVGYYIIFRCTQPDCNIYTGSNKEFDILYLYEDPKTIGPDLLGKPHRVSIRYDDSSNPPKFIFGFDGRLTTPGPSDFLLPLPLKAGASKGVQKGPFTRVSGVDAPLEGGYVSAQFANVATVVDTDGDGVPDSLDNCPTVYNPIVAQWKDISNEMQYNSQPDFDLDGFGDACDLCPKVANDGGPCPATVGVGTSTTTGALIKVTFTYNGPDTFLVPPNCNNVVFSSEPEIPQNCRFREPYILKILEETPGSRVGRPGGDWVPVKTGDSWTINCNPMEIFDEAAFKEAPSVEITPTYTLFFEDPGTDYAGNCLPNEICVDSTQYDLFQGTMIANPVTLTKTETQRFKNVSIDIRPLSHRNIINLQSCGYIPVAIFSTPDFDAKTIKIGTVKMGDAGVKTVVVLKKRIPLALNLDVNGDHLTDKLVFFDIRALNLAKYTGEVCLTGETTGGISFIGCDSVTIVSQKSWNWLCALEDND